MIHSLLAFITHSFTHYYYYYYYEVTRFYQAKLLVSQQPKSLVLLRTAM